MMTRSLRTSLALGLGGYLLVPWYAQEDGFFDVRGWAPYWPLDPDVAPAVLGPWTGRVWLLLFLVPLILPWAVFRKPASDPNRATVLVLSGVLGMVLGVIQGFAIGPLGLADALVPILGPLEVRQFGMGAGALLVHVAFLGFMAEGLAGRGFFRGDVFVAGAFLSILASVSLFILVPIGGVGLRAFEVPDGGGWSVSQVLRHVFSSRVWALGLDGGKVGVGTRTIVLGLLAAFLSTFLGLMLAVVAARTNSRWRRVLGAFTILPVVTPPFVIGLAIVLLFGRAGVITVYVAELLGTDPSRWVFGLPGILIAQVLAFTPVAYMVLLGGMEGMSPTLEEASSTLGATPGQTWRKVTLPLLTPAIANAFLLGFIESLADFGNPLVLGGGFEVLSTEIYFAIAGAESEVSRAAALALVLLALTLGAFWAQEAWTGGRSYVTVTGKADSGVPMAVPTAVGRLLSGSAGLWVLFTGLVYLIVLGGGFVRLLGRDHTLTLEHMTAMFKIGGSPVFSGAAWDSLATTLEISLVSAPITAVVGLLTAWLLARLDFRGKQAFGVLTMLSFAVPGTVVGVGYIMAFNAPPVELTGTAMIIVVCFVFRNMAVGVRSGLASLAQIDPSLDEAALSLGASTPKTLWRVTLPLIRPAVVASLVYGFVRAMTAVSAVIFLVSGELELSTTYILGRVEAGHYGPAVAYASTLVVLMIAVIVVVERVFGGRNLGRRSLVEGS